VSYGVTGQQDRIANYGYIPVYTAGLEGAQYQFGGVPVFTYRPEAYNPDLKWETTKSWNYGLDLALLNNRFTFAADFYTRKTENLLATVPVPAGTNFDKLMLQNVGNVDSKGVELALTAHIIEGKDWSWSATANATWQQVRIKNLTLIPGAPSPDTEVGPWIDTYQMQVFSTDYAPYSFYLYKQLYDSETGRPIEGLYADLDGDGQITTADRYHCPLTRARLDTRPVDLAQIQEMDTLDLAARQSGRIHIQRHGHEHRRLGDHELQRLSAQQPQLELPRHGLHAPAVPERLLSGERLLPQDGQPAAELRLRQGLQEPAPARVGDGAECIHRDQVQGSRPRDIDRCGHLDIPASAHILTHHRPQLLRIQYQ